MKRLLLLFIIALFASGCSLSLAPNSSQDELKTDSIRFAVIGDNEGVNSIYSSLIKKIAEDKSLDFVIHVGDMTANGTNEEYQELTQHFQDSGIAIPVYGVPGNHDIIEDPERSNFNNYFKLLPYSFTSESLHVILLDNAERKVGFTAETLSWLAQDLEASKGTTTVIVYHRPFGYPLASVLGDDETATSRKSNEKFAEIISRYDIAYMFAGHIHSYIEFAFSAGEGENAKTIPVVVSGGGGQELQSLFSSVFSEDYHYLAVELVGDELRVQKIKP